MEDNNDFVLPDEFKDVQAVQGCKSVADLCKKVVDDESFIGKLKSERAMPTENDSDDVWNSFFDKTKAVADKQDWSGMDEEFVKVAKGAGLVKQQTKPILDFIEALKDKDLDEAEFNKMKADAFKGKEDRLNKIDIMLSKLPQEALDKLNATKNEQLVNLYSVFGDIADLFAVKETPTPPATNTNNGGNTLYRQDGTMDKDVLSKMQDELMAIGNVPNKQELKDAIFKKYGWK